MMPNFHSRKVILLVAMSDSIHVARWIAQLDNMEWDIHLFPSSAAHEIHSEIKGITVHSPTLTWSSKNKLLIRGTSSLSLLCSWVAFLVRKKILCQPVPGFRTWRLLLVIQKIQPVLIHSLEIQAAGYLTLDARKHFQGAFPSWLLTNWGSDIFLFGRLSQHQAKITETLAHCDYYSSECERDIVLARSCGFTGRTMPAFPNTGGFDLTNLKHERSHIPPAERKLILLKGYQNWAGRALVGLRSLHRCQDILPGYTVAIYSAHSSVIIAAELFSKETGIPVCIISENTPHREMLSLHAAARISIGLSISDGISTSLLEAMVMGSCPIQSSTACVDEWIVHGVSGMIVPPEDPDVIEKAIRATLTDDGLVNNAALINWKTAQERLDGTLLKQRIADMYSLVSDEAYKTALS